MGNTEIHKIQGYGEHRVTKNTRIQEYKDTENIARDKDKTGIQRYKEQGYKEHRDTWIQRTEMHEHIGQRTQGYRGLQGY